MSHPKVVFDQTINSEVLRLLFVASQISMGFYKDKGIAVLPEIPANADDKILIYFPEFNYTQIPNFWEKAKQTSNDLTFQDNPELVRELTSFIGGKLKVESSSLSKIKVAWRNIEADFWNIIKVIFPDNIQRLGKVNVFVTQYGSRASYQRFGEDDKNILIYLRNDADISHIAWGIISSLLSKNLGKIIHSWEEIMSCVDILMTQTELHAIFPNFNPGLSAIKNTPPQLLEESNVYLAKLGITFEKKLKLIDDELYFKDKSLNVELSINQLKILKLLLNLEGKIVSAYEIGDELWSDSDDFSLWAVNKTMQRLRNKLISLGASPLTLKSVRGKGYILNTTI